MQIESKGWFAVHVVKNHESRVGVSLENKGYESFVPTCRKSSVRPRSRSKMQPMFPGYLFCRVRQQAKSPIVAIPGVIRIVGYGSAPAPVEDSEILALRKIVESGVPAEPLARLEKGIPIAIRKGSLSGVTGILQTVNRRQNLIVLIPLLGRSVMIELPPDWA